MSATRLALVTGSAGAIGGAVAAHLTDAGWQVIVLDLTRSGQSGPFAAQLEGDVARPETWDAARVEVEARGGRLHGLVHGAALQVNTPLLETQPAVWERVLGINLGAFYLGCRALHPALAAGRGSVVGIGSVHARATSTNITAYAASKGGLSALVRALAIEWAPAGIRVNAVLPGAVDSAMLREGLRRGHLQGADEKALLEELARRTVLGRIGRPEDVAEAVAFLLDPQRAGFITGSELVADGGASVRLSTE